MSTPDYNSIINTNYSAIGVGEISKKEAMDDAIECCLPGSFLNCKVGYYPYFGNCPELMAQRCARNWDSTCDVYLAGLTDYTSYGYEAKDFLNKTASKKYCSEGFDPANKGE